MQRDMNNREGITHYKALSIDISASPEEIKRAYRRAARRYHPDTGGSLSSSNKFNFVNEAYRVLSDPTLRRIYDEKISRIQTQTSPRSTNAKRSGTDTRNHSHSSDSHSADVRKSEKSATQNRVRKSTNATKDSSAKKTGFRLNIQKGNTAATIKQTAIENRVHPLSLWNKLKARLGSATRTYELGENNKDTTPDFTATIDALESIQGTAREFNIRETNDPKNPAHVRIKFRIPPGTSNGDILRITRSGDKKLSRTFHVRVQIVRHPYFDRENKDIVIFVPLTFKEAVTGSTIDVPTIDGPIRVTIPPFNSLTDTGNASSNEHPNEHPNEHQAEMLKLDKLRLQRPRLRIRGKGLPLKGGQRSNLILETFVALPDATSEEHMQALDTLEEAYSKNVRADLPLSFTLQHTRTPED